MLLVFVFILLTAHVTHADSEILALEVNGNKKRIRGAEFALKCF